MQTNRRQAPPIGERLRQTAAKVEAETGSDRTEGYTDAMLAYRSHLISGSAEGSTADLVFNIILQDELQRSIVEALLLSSCPKEAAEKALGIPVQAMEWYEELFFNPAAFRTRLDRHAYIAGCTGEGHELRVRALDLGYEYILNLYSGKLPNPDNQREYIGRMLMAAFNKAMIMNYESADSTSARNAREFARLAMQAFDSLDRSAPPDDSAQAEGILAIISVAEESKHVAAARNNDRDTGEREFV